MMNNHKESSIRLAALSGLFDTSLVTAAALTSNSSLLLADAMKTGLEFLAVLLAWVAVRRITRGAGQDFDFGIGKLENLASLAIGALMVAGTVIVAYAAISAIITPFHATGIGIWLSLADQVIWGGLNLWLFRNARAAARRENSPIMASQANMFAAMLFSNVFVFSMVCLSMILSGYSWSVYIDPIAALIVAGTIIMAAIDVFRTSCYDLLDGAVAEDDKLRIMRVLAENFDRYEMVYGLRSRRSGNKTFIEVFLGFEPSRPVGEVEADIAAIRAAIAAHFQNASVVVAIGPDQAGAPA